MFLWSTSWLQLSRPGICSNIFAWNNKIQPQTHFVENNSMEASWKIILLPTPTHSYLLRLLSSTQIYFMKIVKKYFRNLIDLLIKDLLRKSWIKMVGRYRNNHCVWSLYKMQNAQISRKSDFKSISSKCTRAACIAYRHSEQSRVEQSSPNFVILSIFALVKCGKPGTTHLSAIKTVKIWKLWQIRAKTCSNLLQSLQYNSTLLKKFCNFFFQFEWTLPNYKVLKF